MTTTAPEAPADQATLDWLLAAEEPAVRYFTLTDLLDRPADAEEVAAARRAIMQTGSVPAMLAGQQSGGYWGKPEAFYSDKYRGTVWRLMFLAELRADGDDPRLRSASEFILQYAQERDGGGFAHRGSARLGGRPDDVVPCLTGNLVWSLIRLGMLDDARVQRGIDWMARYQRFDDGSTRPPAGSPYERYEMCWGTHTCLMGVVKALKALAAIPEAARSAAVRTTIERGAEFLLVHHLFRRSHDLSQVAKYDWLRLSFPLGWRTDILEMLLVLGELGYADPRLGEAVGAVISKRTPGGRWQLQALPGQRMPVPFERKGQLSRWVTLRALTALRRYAANQERAGMR